ncbi:MAG: formimidoylglutamate deiminase [Rhodobacteraceae bacterium]|jgi:formimidoylglutamate deiminase|nr:formimidoylglutamate deiminase [Paracoccaceae bacterium]
MTTIWARQALLPGGWAGDVAVGIDGGRIASVAPSSPAPAGARRVATLLPAPANLHSHAFQRAMAGLTERRGPGAQDSFWTWRRQMYAFLDRLTPEDVEAIAAFVFLEMIEAGYAAVAEFHYLHHGPGGRPYAAPAEMATRIAAAAATTGIGLTLLPVLYMQGGCDGRPLSPGQDRFGSDLDGFARLLDGAAAAVAALPADCRTGVAPHSLRAVPPHALAAAAALHPAAPIHMHLAEQEAEVAEVRAALGARPADWLLDHADVDGRWCLIHCTQTERAETLRLAATGAVAGLCPITESSLGDGIFDGVAYAGAGGRWGVGSDSNIRIALAEELRTLEYSQRLRDRTRAALATPDRSTGRVLVEAAAQGGAQAAGREAGAIAPGRLADLVALDGGHPDMAGRAGDLALDAWVFARDDRIVTDVWSAGRHILRDGAHPRAAAIGRAYSATMARLLAG